MQKFNNFSEINAFLQQDMTLLEYCKTVIADTILEIREYLTSENNKRFSALRFFDNRQCCIYLKNHTRIIWSIEMTLEQVVIPYLDDIEYVDFDAIPWKKPEPLRTKHPWYYHNLWHELEYMNGYHQYLCDYRFDSVHGAYQYGDAYDISAEHKQHCNRNGRSLFREYPDYQVVVYTKGKEHYTYFANLMDACIGGFIAEQILLSNTAVNHSLEYGNCTYKSKAIHFFPLNEHRLEINEQEFLEQSKTECSQIVHRLLRSLAPSRRLAFNIQQNTVIAEFIYIYIHSLRWCSIAENFTIIYPLFCNYLQTNRTLTNHEKESLIHEITDVCHANYYDKPSFDSPNTPLQHFQAAVWALVNSTTYMEAISNILSFVNFQHEGQLAVTLTGAFAGIYYQHYRIPQKYLTENRYYTHFSNSIIPLEKIRFY